MSSGLLSLNVHEPLVFEGTEICLHPDILQQQSAQLTGVDDRIGTRHSVASASNTSSSLLNNGGISAPNSRFPGLSHAFSISGPATSEKAAISAAATAHHRDGRQLQAGDMIMIRVWDPLSPEERAINSNSSVSRKQTSQPLFRSSSANTSSSVVAVSKDGDGNGTGSTLSPTTGGQGNSILTSDSFQTSFASPRTSPLHSTSETELSTCASGALEKNSTFRPPIVPRGKTTGILNNSFLGATGNNKSHGFPWQTDVNQTNRVVANTDALSRLRISTNSSPVLPRPRHSRDLSDISIDTSIGPGQGGSRRPSMDTTKTAAVGSVTDDSDDRLNEITSTHSLRLSFVMQVTEKSLKGLKASSRTHISILRQVAELYQLSTYDIVTVHKLSGAEAEKALQSVSADFLLVTIKDQFVSRGELHFFQSSLVGSWIYEGQRLYEPSRGIHANAREIRHGGVEVCSGIVTESTKFVYRSRSSRIFWLVQMSAEMWDYASPFQASQKESYCEVYFDRFISFVYDLFEKWKHAEVTHSLTVVFFSRTFLNAAPSANVSHDPNIQRDIYGRKYEDHFRVVIENETRTDWDALVVRLKEAFLSYPNEVGWNLSSGVGARRPSTAGQGNLLEALNVTLNLLQYHFLDRDLHRTGNSIVVVSAGNGVFEVDKKLALITYQRMMDNGIGSDMLSLGLPPLHVAPFFLYFNEFQEVESEIPHWIHLSFISYESNDSLVALNATETDGKEKASDGASVHEPVEESPAEQQKQKSNVPKPLEAGSKTSSPHKSKASSTSSKGRNERHLGDRDIRDILEACRPRSTGLLPPSLKSLLEMYEIGETQRYTAINPSEQKIVSDYNIREWDGIDLDEINNRKLLLFSLEKREQPRPSAPDSPPPMVEVDRLETATQASSFTSQIPHLLLGTSHDRNFLSRDLATAPTRAKMQRASSMGSICGSTSETHESEDGDLSFLRMINQKMQKYDRLKMITNIKSPKILPQQPDIEFGVGMNDSIHSFSQGQGREHGIIGSSVIAPVTVHHAGPPGAPQIAISGIGAALSQYSNNLSRETSDSEKSGALSRSFERSRSIPRSSSAGFVVSPFTENPNKAPRSLSPLVLPPSLPSFSSQGETHFIPHVGPYSNERRFIRAQDLPMAFRDGQRNVSVNSALENGPLSTTPEKYLENHRWSHQADSERQMKSHASPGSESRKVRMMQHSDGGIFPRRPTSPGSESRVTRNWQQRGFLDRYVSTENARSRSSLSPISRSRHMSSSADTNAARAAQYGGPPGKRLDPDRRKASPSPVTRTRPRSSSTGQPHGTRSKSGFHKSGVVRESSSGLSSKHSTTTRRRKPINPFRQQDEDEVLAQKSHNSRRWSHVFPLGEIEFKRMSGPNWKSLAAPATLPLSIDYFPSRRERELNFTFSIYNVTLSDFERNNFSSNKELLLEMVRQRITQDYQLVPSFFVDDSDEERRRLVRKDGKDGAEDDIRMYLSIGHRLQILHYDPASDTVEVKTYMAINAQGNNVGSFKYFYKIYCKETNSYVRMVQDFKQFTLPYNWNKVDRIICGDEDREMREGMRFKRLMFTILPEKFSDFESEKAYVDKFKKLLDYFEKLRAKEETKTPLNVSVVTSDLQKEKVDQASTGFLSTPGIAGNSMVRFYVPFRKGGREQFEYLEVSIDSTFNTSWSYRIIFNWLVASSGKVDTQVQLLQRRCNQFRLNLISSPELSVSKMLFLNPFKAPSLFTIRKPEDVPILVQKLTDLDFIHDGVFPTYSDFVDCIDHGKEFQFGPKTDSHQVIHRTGLLYIRMIPDYNGKAVVVAITNIRLLQKDESLNDKYLQLFKQFMKCIEELNG